MELLTVEDLQAKLKVKSKNTIYSWVRREYIPKKAVVKITKKTLNFISSEIDEWLKSLAAA